MWQNAEEGKSVCVVVGSMVRLHYVMGIHMAFAPSVPESTRESWDVALPPKGGLKVGDRHGRYRRFNSFEFWRRALSA